MIQNYNIGCRFLALQGQPEDADSDRRVQQGGHGADAAQRAHRRAARPLPDLVQDLQGQLRRVEHAVEESEEQNERREREIDK